MPARLLSVCPTSGRARLLPSRELRENRLGRSLALPNRWLRGQTLSPVRGMRSMNLPTYADVVAAAPIVHRYLPPTPLYEWPALSRLLGCRYLLKHENHTPTTAFKVRGGLNVIARLPDEQKRVGVIGCTTGNHGQSLAYACGRFGVRCVLVVPAKNNPDKVEAMRALGAEIIEHGQDFDEARVHCESVCRREGLRYIHSANEPDLIAGVGT